MTVLFLKVLIVSPAGSPRERRPHGAPQVCAPQTERCADPRDWKEANLLQDRNNDPERKVQTGSPQLRSRERLMAVPARVRPAQVSSFMRRENKTINKFYFRLLLLVTNDLYQHSRPPSGLNTSPVN